MAYTGGASVEALGLPEVIKSIGQLEAVMRKEANTELRAGAKLIAAKVVRGGLIGGSGVPTDPAISAAARPKSDRYISVQVPGVKPKLSGLRKTPAARARSLAIAVEYGSTSPGLKGPPRGALVGRNINRISDTAVREYQQLLARILRKYGLI